MRCDDACSQSGNITTLTEDVTISYSLSSSPVARRHCLKWFVKYYRCYYYYCVDNNKTRQKRVKGHSSCLSEWSCGMVCCWKTSSNHMCSREWMCVLVSVLKRHWQCYLIITVATTTPHV